MNEQLALMYERIRRDKIKCTVIISAVFIFLAVMFAAVFYFSPARMGATEPTTYEYTDEAGNHITVTQNARQTVTIVTSPDGKIISYSSIGSRPKTSEEIKEDKAERERKAADRADKKAERAAAKAQRKADREAAKLEREAAKLERQAEKARAKADKARAKADSMK